MVDDWTVKYCYDGDHTIVEYDSENRLLRKYIYGPRVDEPICMVNVADNNEVYYYHFDGLGSVIALSDEDGNTVQTYEYTVYGQVAAEDVNHPNPITFTGRWFDRETGLYYYRARYYNPYIGRFLQTDPVGYGYGYCSNNPVAWVDPSGCWELTKETLSYEQRAYAYLWEPGTNGLLLLVEAPDFNIFWNTYGVAYHNGIAPGGIITVTEIDGIPFLRLDRVLGVGFDPAALPGFLTGGEMMVATGITCEADAISAATAYSETLGPATEEPTSSSSLCPPGEGYPTTTSGKAWYYISGAFKGAGHGLEIAADEFTFGGSDWVGLTHGSELAKRYGGWGTASKWSARISRDALLIGAGLKAGGIGSKIAHHGPHHRFPIIGKRSHIQTTIWRKGVKGSHINIRLPLPR